MAKGFESKSVEDQVAEFEARASKKGKIKLSRDEAVFTRQKQVLALSRSRIQSELETCTIPRRREQLTQALAQLEAQLAELSAPVKS